MADLKRRTVQRDVVEDIVCCSYDHPTADAIFRRAQERLPQISLATVYRLLKDLVQDGVAQEVKLKNSVTVYDKTTTAHAHLVCDRCGAVEDVFIDGEAFKRSVDKDCKHALRSAQITFDGVCEKCRDIEALARESQ